MLYSYNYPRMLVTVDSLVFKPQDNSSFLILLVKRGNEPYKGQYALPGGFPEMDELLADAAIRELHEETGLSNISLKPLSTFDAVDRDPRGRNISLTFYGFANSDAKATAGDDAAEAEWFPLSNLPKLAFDHKQIVELAIDRLGLK
ncbi:MAG TPA: NUDIX hydrolase [Tenuifilaceae bacterium]|nr:NUDIX hydrolase [Tenuifilaceae bacterium]